MPPIHDRFEEINRSAEIWNRSRRFRTIDILGWRLPFSTSLSRLQTRQSTGALSRYKTLRVFKGNPPDESGLITTPNSLCGFAWALRVRSESHVEPDPLRG